MPSDNLRQLVFETDAVLQLHQRTVRRICSSHHGLVLGSQKIILESRELIARIDRDADKRAAFSRHEGVPRDRGGRSGRPRSNGGSE